jgi:hypothetical protein
MTTAVLATTTTTKTTVGLCAALALFHALFFILPAIP